MRNITLNFDPDLVRRQLNKEPWEEHEPGVESRCIGLGSVMSLTPSGKYYMPWAAGNLDNCPVCNGTGRRPSPVPARRAKKWKHRNQRVRRLWVKRHGPAVYWPAKLQAKSDHLNRLLARAETVCPRCHGLGSHEAADDERWHEAAEAALEARGMSLEASEGDSTYYIAVEYRDAPEEEEDGDGEL